ncbi:MAG TPA: hypothetical protein VFI65_05430 [Streptosporangiaceae bacterium]|nr:hypothetical protein [Streptosporangiaceae bacterium]
MTLDSTGLPAPPSGGAPDNPASNLTAGSTSPPRWWTLPIPVLLLLPAAAWSFLFAAVSGLESCFDSCMPTAPFVTPIGIIDFFLGVAAVIALVVGLAVRASRRALRLALWIACTLSWVGAIYLLVWSSNNP